MKRFSLAALAALTIALTSFATPAVALDAAEKEEIGAFIREYLMTNPELLEEVQTALQVKREAEVAAMATHTIAANADAIYNAPEDIVLGNPDGDVTIVEFYDYNCGFCKRALDDMNQLIEADSNLRFVLKEFPILGPDSMAAHKVAMSFRKLMPEKYGEFHRKLLGSEARATEETAMDLAKSLGGDEEQLIAGMNAPEINRQIGEVYQLADALGINGTPSYVVGDEAVFGARGTEVLKEKIANMRACESTSC